MATESAKDLRQFTEIRGGPCHVSIGSHQDGSARAPYIAKEAITVDNAMHDSLR